MSLEALEQKLASTESPDTQLYFDLAEAYLEHEQFENASQYFQKVTQSTATVLKGQAYHLLGNIYANQQAWKKAIQQYRLALEWKEKGDKETLGNTYRNLGTIYLQLEDWNASLESFNEAIHQNEISKNYKELGRVFIQLRALFHYAPINDSKAISIYQEIKENAKENNHEVTIAYTNHNLGLIYEADYKNEQAKTFFQDALDLKLKNEIDFELGLTYHLCGIMLDDLGEHQKAIVYNVLGLKYMLQNQNYEKLGIIIHFLDTSLPDCEEESIKEEGMHLLKEAKEKMSQIEDTVTQDELIQEAMQEQKVKESQIMSYQTIDFDELEQTFDITFEKLQHQDENIDDFVTLSIVYLERLKNSVGASFLSMFAKKKNKLRKEKFIQKKQEVLDFITKQEGSQTAEVFVNWADKIKTL